MAEERGMSKGRRRLLALACALILAASPLFALSFTVWAQGEQQQAEQPTTAEQPQQEKKGDGLVIDYWEPEVGTRTVYYINDFWNDMHGNIYGTGWLGYLDAPWLYQYTITNNHYPVGFNYAALHYYNVEAISDMNPVYFDLQGPWYFNMTTPYKLVTEVKGIHEVPDASLFPEATYAVSGLYIFSGGHRLTVTSYCSNNPGEKTWNTWGFTREYVQAGSTTPTKDVAHFRNPANRAVSAPFVWERFPKKVGDAGSKDAVYVEGGGYDRMLPGTSYEVVAEGKVTVPGGAKLDALLVRYEETSPLNGTTYKRTCYDWFVAGMGTVAHTESLPNVLGPTYGEASGYESRNKSFYSNSLGMMVLESSTAGAGSK